MALNKRNYLLISFIVIAIFVILIFLLLNQNTSSGPPGYLEGAVTFIGVPCQPNQGNAPPCDGSYPNYDVIIYSTGLIQKEVARTKTNENGNYRISLNPGKYLIKVPSGINRITESEIVIESGKTTYFDINVDTGIR